ncbi:hypothetical protein HMPREF9103_02931 [Lentilactobacillus parafarraginis F0439]|uniref:Uncharacterized protein n=1 Tax=Lentilactobacillus parafarraginis F0439 TaxID=797515 RepID=G9ZT13_9LACO|nr:hypothetical protein HMPREF9103_02931 [Lentilactobacillus parafarraginis F0439]
MKFSPLSGNLFFESLNEQLFKFRHLYKLRKDDKLSLTIMQVTISCICLNLDKKLKMQNMR